MYQISHMQSPRPMDPTKTPCTSQHFSMMSNTASLQCCFSTLYALHSDWFIINITAHCGVLCGMVKL